MFEELMDAYLGAGTALSGVQPKVMVPGAGKANIAAPNVIAKTDGALSRAVRERMGCV